MRSRGNNSRFPKEESIRSSDTCRMSGPGAFCNYKLTICLSADSLKPVATEYTCPRLHHRLTRQTLSKHFYKLLLSSSSFVHRYTCNMHKHAELRLLHSALLWCTFGVK